MKLSARDAAQYFRAPRATGAGILIYGADAMRVALKRQDLVAALLGPGAEEEMRLTRLAGADLRRDKAALLDAIKASGFFPGQRIVLVDDATDGLAPIFQQTLEDWAEGDAFIVATAGSLTARSALRKLFEGARETLIAAIYTDPPGREEIEAQLSKAGLTNISGPAMRDLTALGQALDPGDFRQFAEKLGLYKIGDDTPLTPEDITAVAPPIADAALDDIVRAAAEGALQTLGAALPRLAAQGVNPTTLCIALQRHFRQLHAAASHPQGPDQGLARMRPPVFGPRRDQMLRQARHWGLARLEDVLSQILETDRTLRSSAPVPPGALMERLLIRIAMLHNR